MVRDGHGRLAPLVGLGHQLAHRGDAVHVGHTAVQVQLHPLLIAGGVVHHLHLVHGGDGLGPHHVLPVVLVIFQGPPHQQGLALFQLVQLLALGGVLQEFQGGGAGIVRDVDGVDLPGLVPGLLALNAENLPPHHRRAQIQAQLGKGYGMGLGHLAQQGPGALQNDLGQQELPFPDFHPPAGSLVGHLRLILLHLPQGLLPLALHLLPVDLLHQRAVPLLHGQLAVKAHRAVQAEPGGNQALHLSGGVPGLEHFKAPVGQTDHQHALLQPGAGPVQAAVEAGVPLLEGSGQGGQILRGEGLLRELGLHTHPAQVLARRQPAELLDLGIVHQPGEPDLQDHIPLPAVHPHEEQLPLQKLLGQVRALQLLLEKSADVCHDGSPLAQSLI